MEIIFFALQDTEINTIKKKANFPLTTGPNTSENGIPLEMQLKPLFPWADTANSEEKFKL